MKVLVYRKCSTCMKALKWLEVNQVVFDERPIKEENPSYEELKAWYEMSGLPLKKFFNTSGILYKQMNLKDKLKEMSEDEQLKLLATDGMLVKRPLLVGEETVLLSPKEVEILHLMASHARQVFTREQLLDNIWGFDFNGDPRVVDTSIKRIRKKLPTEGVHYAIQSIYGVGYRLGGVT